ncbi:MAG: adenylate/guanylate cyclase domain-containing protein [Acidimicrobiia bacterium]|nr:adenylate/guanylate cyclase domain-containing protein [Acidimicrobiia bacterium]
MSDLPTGTVTFLFTDLEGSTRLWEEHPEAMKGALASHDELLRELVRENGGHVVKSTGDGMHAAFETAHDAVAAASGAQSALAARAWGATGPLRVRMGIHTGEAESRDGDYFGTAPNRAARLMAIAHGGQVLVSNVTMELVGDVSSSDVQLVDLGEHRLRDLSRPEHVYQLVIGGLDQRFLPLRSIDVLATNLPVQLTSFVGRAAELESVVELSTGHRVVTLTGVGGVGKTRLALQVAAESLERFRDGAWVVELSSVEAARVVAVIAAAFDVEVRSGWTMEASLIDVLCSRSLLLVLDNCEHLISEVRRVVEVILREAPGVSLLVTSREGLRVPGEQLYSVPSLSQDAAIELFLERAATVDSRLILSENDQVAVAGVCRRLDGIPLAIELAAARVSMFSIEELAHRLDQRFRLLTGGRGAVERHQTLRAAVDWSYDLLTPVERVVFARLSVFAGGCTMDAAEAVVVDADHVVEEVLDLLSGLVDKSLVIVDRARSVTRYDMLETVRQYAHERLVDSGEAEVVRHRHAQWYVDFARAAGRGLNSADEEQWLEQLRVEIDNLEVAVGWALNADETDVAMRIGGSFPRQGGARPLLGTAFLAEQALTVIDADRHPLRARVLAEAGWANAIRGDGVTATRMFEEAIEAQRAGARFSAAAFIYLLLVQGWHRGAHESAAAYDLAKEGLEMAEAAGDVLGTNGLRIALAAEATMTERDAEGLELAERALTDALRLGQPTLVAAALYIKAMALARPDPRRAITLLHEALDILRQLENDSERIPALGLLAALEGHHGNARQSLEAIREQMTASAVSGYFVASNLYIGIQVFNRVGRPDLVAQCDGYCQEVGVMPPPFYFRYHEESVREARAALGTDSFERHLATGTATPTDDFYEMIVREVDELLAGMPAD